MVALQPLLKQRGGWKADQMDTKWKEEGRGLELLKQEGNGSSQKQQQHVPLRRTKLFCNIVSHCGLIVSEFLSIRSSCRVAEILHLKFELAGSKLVSSLIPRGADTKQKMERVFH